MTTELLRRRERQAPAQGRQDIPRVNWDALDEFVAVHRAGRESKPQAEQLEAPPVELGLPIADDAR